MLVGLESNLLSSNEVGELPLTDLLVCFCFVVECLKAGVCFVDDLGCLKGVLVELWVLLGEKAWT